ncbi:MAG: YbaK/EbsC family protein [Chloroflexota bacterium]
MMTLSRRTSTDMQSYIDSQGIQAEMLLLDEDTPTVPEAARVLGVAPEQIVKSLVFLVNKAPILIIANGTHRVDRRKVAKHFSVGVKKVKFASAEQALDITGYIVGSMPPFGHKTTLDTYIDPQIMTWPTIFGGGGEIHAMIKLTPAELQKFSQGHLLPVLE